MADPDAEITLEAKGKTYTIVYGNRAFRTIEKELHRPIVRLNQESLDDLTTVIWGGLLANHPGITIDEVDDIIDEVGYVKIGEIVKTAVEKALPEAAEKEPALGNPNRATRRAQANGTGKA